jgi:hypothetical protein
VEEVLLASAAEVDLSEISRTLSLSGSKGDYNITIIIFRAIRPNGIHSTTLFVYV